MSKVLTEPDAPANAPLWRRFYRFPLFWALGCVALALPWYLAGNGMDLLPFLLTLLGGWLCGFAFVNFTLGVKRAWLGVLLHVVGAAVSGVLLHWMVFGGSSIVKELPEQTRSLLFLVQMGAIPAVAWMWLGLLSRITFSASKPSKKAKAAKVAPSWEDASPGTRVRFSAIPLPMRTLTMIIVGVVLLGGAVALLLLISFDTFLLRLGSARFIIIVFGLLIGFPGYYLFLGVVGRKTVPCAVSFGNDRITVTTGPETVAIPYRDLDRLLWRCDSDYARVEVHGGGHRISLLVAVARSPKTVLPQLPPLSQRTIRGLAETGLELERTRRPGLTVLVAGTAKARVP